MPVKEHVTYQKVYNAVEPQAISTDTTTTGAIFDTADWDCGIYFAVLCYDYTDGTYTLKIEHGDNAALSDAADVSSDMLVYGTLPAVSAAIAEGASMIREGVHSTKRYVRASLVSTDTDTGASLAVVAVKDSETMKTAQV